MSLEILNTAKIEIVFLHFAVFNEKEGWFQIGAGSILKKS